MLGYTQAYFEQLSVRSSTSSGRRSQSHCVTSKRKAGKVGVHERYSTMSPCHICLDAACLATKTQDKLAIKQFHIGTAIE